MVPYIFAMRMMANANSNPNPEKPMTCKTPCKNCTCDSVYEVEAFEIDPSPLATQAKKFLEEEAKRIASPASFYERFCSENPRAQECKIYED